MDGLWLPVLCVVFEPIGVVSYPSRESTILEPQPSRPNSDPDVLVCPNCMRVIIDRLGPPALRHSTKLRPNDVLLFECVPRWWRPPWRSTRDVRLLDVCWLVELVWLVVVCWLVALETRYLLRRGVCRWLFLFDELAVHTTQEYGGDLNIYPPRFYWQHFS